MRKRVPGGRRNGPWKASRQGGVFIVSMFAVSALLLGTTGAIAGDSGPKRPPIYDTKIDGATQIAEALVKAKRDHKHVLLQFGANWCVWCHRLDGVLKVDKALAKLIQYEYEFVLIDVDDINGKRHNDEIDARYGRPTKNGLPAWVILDADGKQLVTINTEPLEQGDGYDTSKVAAALNKWKAKPVSAKEVLSHGLNRAKSQQKDVFLHFSAPWCSYCKHMDAFLLRDDVAAVFGKAFVPVKVDVERMTGGVKMGESLGRREEDGVPFFAILDSNGKKLADSRGEKGNVGFPVEPFEIEHFMKVVSATAKSLSKKELEILKHGLTAKP